MRLEDARRWGDRLLDLCLPPACAACGRVLGSSRVRDRRERPRICPGCLSRLQPPPHPRCPRCHAPRGTGLPADRPCTECHDWPTILHAARTGVRMAPPADTLVHALKYGGWPELSGEMAARMVRENRTEPALVRGDPVVPVPTTVQRLRARGYNQALELARGVSRETGGALVEALVRKDGGGSQVALHRGERRDNVQGAFFLQTSVAEAIRERSVVLVDDVLTTGATACAAAEALAAGGVRSVVLLTFARALPS